MEKESFEDEEVAQVLNKSFISIKVDREERPDIDHIYMSVCQALTGSGGWPLTIIMTPDKKPFFAGTYFPKTGRMGYSGLIEILDQITELWRNDRSKVLTSVEQIMMHMEHSFGTKNGEEIPDEAILKTFENFKESFDSTYGGFGRAPKFPTPHNLCFLLRYYKHTGDDEALNMVEKTIEQMYRGGIYDHIGFGFSRYSTDRKWLVPHFEKMLYDNALLAIACLEAYQATHKEQYRQIVEQIFEYVLRDMTSPEGAFYSAEDADSEGEEGKFYVWVPEELSLILGNEDGERFCREYDITEDGNFEEENIPNFINSKRSFEDIASLPMNALRERVFQYREGRVHPYKDDKILTSWNGLMIAAMAYGARALQNDRYLNAAVKTVEFIREKLIRSDGRLLARYRDGEAAYPAYIDDYAFLVWGLIELYQVDFKPEHLELALTLTDDMIKLFFDDENGGLFIYGSDAEELIARPKEIYDGATPSGNSVATLNLLRLARITGRMDLEEKADAQFKAFGKIISSHPSAYSHFMMAFLFARAKSKEVILVGDRHDTELMNMIKVMDGHYLPNTVIVFKDILKDNGELKKLIGYIEHNHAIDDKSTAYVCEDFACRAPVTNVNEFEKLLIQ